MSNSTILIGLAAPARCGKDTAAAYLQRRYGYLVFSFSDSLYAEVQAAYGLPDQSLLRDAATKEVPTEILCLDRCKDAAFTNLALTLGLEYEETHDFDGSVYEMPLSPRTILQWWGTEYRRAQNPNYWLDKAAEFVTMIETAYPYPEARPGLVNTSVRFENERRWISDMGGTVWHIHRDGAPKANHHIAEAGLPVIEGERELYNNDTIERLHYGIDLLMSSSAKHVKVNPMRKTGAEIANT